MLYTQTVSAKLLELLKSLRTIETLNNLRLVGGTSLALQIGHRNSVDIDLFGRVEIDKYELVNVLRQLGEVTSVGGSRSINIFLVNGVKVDIVNYPYPWIQEPLSSDYGLLAQPKDIAAMKVAAITQRGSKKDFIDIYFLLKQFSLKEIFDFYEKKITDGNAWMALKSMTYFDDADTQPMPVMLHPVSWKEVKTEIVRHISTF